MAKLKTKSALSYFGSDSEVALQLAGMLDHCKHVTIPFCGGLSILPHLKARAVVANDLHYYAMVFYRVASGTFGEDQRAWLINRCQKTLSHPAEMKTAQKYLEEPKVHMPCREAWAFWTVCWVGRKGSGGTKKKAGLPSVRRTAIGGTNATRIRAAADDLALWCKHFERCEWESVCFTKLLPKVADQPDVGIYADPPWVDAGNAYFHSFSEADHIELANQLNRFDCTTVVLRYGDHSSIRELYEGDRWRIMDAESRDQQNVRKPEIWITNRSEV